MKRMSSSSRPQNLTLLLPQIDSVSSPSPIPVGVERRRRGGDRRSRAERRRSTRLPLSVAVRQEVLASPARSAELHLAQSLDVGLGGMRLVRSCAEGEPALPVHTPLRLAFQLPDERGLLEIAGEVVFDRMIDVQKSHRATGVSFGALPADAAARLQRFLQAAPESSPARGPATSRR